MLLVYWEKDLEYFRGLRDRFLADSDEDDEEGVDYYEPGKRTQGRSTFKETNKRKPAPKKKPSESRMILKKGDKVNDGHKLSFGMEDLETQSIPTYPNYPEDKR